MTRQTFQYQAEFDIPPHKLTAETGNMRFVSGVEPAITPRPAIGVMVAAAVATTGLGFVAPPVAVTTPLVSAESPQLTGKQFQASQQQVEAFAPQGAIFSITPQGWTSESPVVLAKAFNTAQQQVEAFAPRGSFQFTNWGWTTESPVLSVKPYNAAQQQVEAFAPRGSLQFINWGWSSESPALLTKPFNAVQQQVEAFAPEGSFQFTNWGWSSESPALLGKSYSAAQQQFTAEPVSTYGQVTTFTIWGWATESAPDPAKPYSAAQQQFQEFVPQGPIFSTTPLGWMSVSYEPIIKPFNTSLQQVTAEQTQFYAAPTFIPTAGWQPVIYEPRAPVFNTAQQQFASPWPPYPGFQTIGIGYTDVLIAYYNVLLEEGAVSPFAPRGTIFSVTPQGWASESPQIYKNPRYGVGLQQAIAAAVQSVPTATTPEGFQAVTFDPVIRGFNVSLQQFSGMLPFPYTTVITAQIPHNLPWFATMGKMKSF